MLKPERKLMRASTVVFALVSALSLTAQAQDAAQSAEESAKQEPAATAAAAEAAPAQGAASPVQSRRAANDRIDLETTIVTGNRELPKVLYIVPWKKAELGELPGQPFNTLLDEVLTPIDRDVFRREVTYYGAITNEQKAAPAAPATPVQAQ